MDAGIAQVTKSSVNTLVPLYLLIRLLIILDSVPQDVDPLSVSAILQL